MLPRERRIRDEVFERAMLLDRAIGEMAVEARERGLDDEVTRRRLLRRVRRGETPDATETARRIGRRARNDILLGIVPYVVKRCLRLAPSNLFSVAFAQGMDIADERLDEWKPETAMLPQFLSTYMNVGINIALYGETHPHMSYSEVCHYRRVAKAEDGGVPWEMIPEAVGLPSQRVEAVTASYRILMGSIEEMLESGNGDVLLATVDEGMEQNPQEAWMLLYLEQASHVMERCEEKKKERRMLAVILSGEDDERAAKKMALSLPTYSRRKKKMLRDIRKEILDAVPSQDGHYLVLS